VSENLVTRFKQKPLVCSKNTENFASKREEGKREMKIQIWREGANTGLGDG
jgi:hypothetical protein